MGNNSTTFLMCLMTLVAVFGNCFSQPPSHTTKPNQELKVSAITEEEINQRTEMLGSEDYLDREHATEWLIQGGPVVIKPVLGAWDKSSVEKRYRIKRVLKKVIPKLDPEQHAEVLEILKSTRSSKDAELSSLVSELIGAEPDKALTNELKTAIAQVLNGEKSTVPVSDELFKKLNNTDAFQVVSRPPLRDRDRKTPWRTIQDSNAHQEILIYRVKWFNGSWSGWMLSGVNDRNEKAERQHWNNFYDHHHQYVQILTLYGNHTKRNDYLPSKTEEDSK